MAPRIQVADLVESDEGVVQAGLLVAVSQVHDLDPRKSRLPEGQEQRIVTLQGSTVRVHEHEKAHPAPPTEFVHARDEPQCDVLGASEVLREDPVLATLPMLGNLVGVCSGPVQP